MSSSLSFEQLGLASPLVSSLIQLGYEQPTPIQAESIPVLLEWQDLIAQAQTGTGKTAAFALPILEHLELEEKAPQALVIVPTRELAIQVAEAFVQYAKQLKGFHVAPIYGGSDYKTQLRALSRGCHVVVGTPGRVIDHIRRGSLKLDCINTVVLDEADEMLKMGFIDDMEWILGQIKHDHQTALFSATMPVSIQKIAKRYLNKEASKIQIKPQKNTVDSIEQCFTRVANNQKLEVLTRFLEIEDFQAAIIFARTKGGSNELAEKLQARGYAAAALNGDMNQALRKKVVERIKQGSLDIIVATDVAARGIDVERITHVINYDIPYDTESYIHRIGRTGRAGRQGKALLFVTPREFGLLKDIERAIGKSIVRVDPPSAKDMSEKRSQQFCEQVQTAMEAGNKLTPYRQVIESLIEEQGADPKEIAIALAYLAQKENPLQVEELAAPKPKPKRDRERRPKSQGPKDKAFKNRKPRNSKPKKRRGDSRS